MRLSTINKTRWTRGVSWLTAGTLTTLVLAGAWGALANDTPRDESPKKHTSGTATTTTERATKDGSKDPKGHEPTSITTGSGERYRTTVNRKPEGQLSSEDFRQASLLSSRIVIHLNKAVERLHDDSRDEARSELEKAQGLLKVVRELLPTTVVTTTVRDKNGNEVYRYVDRVQDERIPLHEGLVAVEVVEPITSAKQEAAEVEGLRLADAELLHTSVLVELGYIERKVHRALKLVKDKPEDALVELVLAQTRGISYSVNKKDNPLVNAQLALQLAERMVEQGRTEAAKANLQLAKNYLDVHRGLVGKHASDEIRKLQADITNAQSRLEAQGAAKEIRGFWDRVASWFSRQPGETRSTGESAPQGASRLAN